MRSLFLALLLLWSSVARADNSSVPTKPYSFSAHTAAVASQVNADFDTVFTALANIGTANILANGVGPTQLAANSVTLAKLDTNLTQSIHQTGFVQDYIGTTAPSGWVLADGRTIGSAGSGALNRANADCLALYVLIYGSMADAQAPVSGGRTGNAATDFSNGKTIVVPDLRGRVVAGVDNMGGTGANRLTNAESGITGTTNGLAGGTQSTTISISQLPSHTHPVAAHLHTIPGSFVNGFQSGATATGLTNSSTINTGNQALTTDATGSGSTHTNTQPTMVLYKIIKL